MLDTSALCTRRRFAAARDSSGESLASLCSTGNSAAGISSKMTVVSRPPPPPSTTSSFPFCQCTSKSLNSFPWRVSTVSRAPIRSGERVCLKVYVDPIAAATCNPRWGCCRAGLHKIEFDSDLSCRGSITNMVLNGVPKSSYVFDSATSAFKFTVLDQTYDQGVSGVSLCFDIRKTLTGTGCGSLDELCKGDSCKYAIFNPPGSACCPVSYF